MQILIALISALTFNGVVSQDDTVARAFAHYEAIRAALAADSIAGISKHAEALAPLAEKVAGGEAKKTADQVGSAKDIKAAREHFGKLSVALIPAFEKARLSGVHFFTCPMVKQAWAQKGKDIENPYYGKSMLDCGLPKK